MKIINLLRTAAGLSSLAFACFALAALLLSCSTPAPGYHASYDCVVTEVGQSPRAYKRVMVMRGDTISFEITAPQPPTHWNADCTRAEDR